MKYVFMTPEKAKELLDINVRNRSINQRLVNRIAGDISKGNWQVNGETIKVSSTNKLLDGQHRLSAIIKSGMPCHLWVVEGLDDNCHATIDSGLSRGAHHILQIENIQNASLLASTIALIKKIEKQNISNSKRASNIDILDNYKKDPEGLDAAARFITGRSWLRRYAGNSIACACYYVASKLSESQASEFFEKLSSGAGLSEGSPILACRNYLIKQRMNRGIAEVGRKIKFQTYQVIAKCWNAYREGNQLSRILLRSNDQIKFK